MFERISKLALGIKIAVIASIAASGQNATLRAIRSGVAV